MPEKDVLADLLNRCARGDQKAFELLYAKTSAKLYAICFMLVKREDMAEDVLQESFIKIWHRANSYNPIKGSAITWMTSIVRNRALDMLRSTQFKSSQSLDDHQEAGFTANLDNPMEITEMDALTAAMMKCLDQLQEQQKRSILMAYCFGYTHDELSRILEAPLGTVKAWIRRGIKRIRECLE